MLEFFKTFWLIFLVLIVVIVLVALVCPDPKESARMAVESQGFSHVEVGSWAFFSGSQDDTFKYHFTAVNAQGQDVSGIVTGGPVKGYTVRFR